MVSIDRLQRASELFRRSHFPSVVEIKKLGLPEFSGLSFVSKVRMFLDPDKSAVLDWQIMKINNHCPTTLLANLHIGKSTKSGPLTAYLRWHAWTTYGWKPEHVAQPEMPTGYSLEWRYFTKFDAPNAFIAQRIAELDNERLRLLRPIMQKRGML